MASCDAIDAIKPVATPVAYPVDGKTAATTPAAATVVASTIEPTNVTASNADH